MALPYYECMPPSNSPVMSMNDFYTTPTASIDLVPQVQRQHYIDNEMVYQNLREVIYPLSYGYQHDLTSSMYLPTLRPPPSMPNIVKPQPMLASQDTRLTFPLLPSMIYPNVTLTSQVSSPQDYTNVFEPRRCYLSELKTAAERLIAADIKAKSQSKLKPRSDTEFDLRRKKPILKPKPIDRVVISNDTAVPKVGAVPKIVLPSTAICKSYLENRFGLCYDMTLLQNPSLRKPYGFDEDYKPGPGQEYISKIRALVEGSPTSDRSNKNWEPPLLPTSLSNKCKKRKNSDEFDSQEFSKYLRYDLYPRTVPLNPGHWFIGKNGTFVPASFYETISWQSTMECTKRLMEFIFDDGSLATHTLYGENRLDPAIIDDVVDHVSSRCFVKKQHVRSTIIQVCCDAASQRFKRASS